MTDWKAPDTPCHEGTWIIIGLFVGAHGEPGQFYDYRIWDARQQIAYRARPLVHRPGNFD